MCSNCLEEGTVEGLEQRRVTEANEDMDLVLAPVGLAFKKMLKAFERDTGVSPGKYFVLRMLARQDGISQGEAWNRFAVDPSRITRLAKSLEKEGLVRRERDPEDNRVVRMYLTEEGHRMIDEFSSRHERFESRVREAVSEEDLGELQRILGVLTEAMNDPEEEYE
ncbi:MAG: MarR family transcriptional regulator [Acidobacteriaceae bacterium]|nr:MarR family transcriptional regulator [Acidobacteriaceae bacterium]